MVVHPLERIDVKKLVFREHLNIGWQRKTRDTL